MNLLLSVDVEEWFQAENLKSVIHKKDWDTLPLRIEKNSLKVLSILNEFDTKATFFVLGWIAERVPNLVKEIASQGHEIASHGYDHELVHTQTPEQFRKDLLRSKEILEKYSGQTISGFRAPTFSMTGWALDIIRQEGFAYDSSYLSTKARQDFHLLMSRRKKEGCVFELDEQFFEVCLATRSIVGFSVPWSGGGYFRLMPYSLFKRGVQKILRESESYCFYIHPWEFDPEQPKVPAPFIKRFKHYHAIDETEGKFRALLGDYKFEPIRKALSKTDGLS